MFVKIMVTAIAVIVFALGTYTVDDYYGDKTLEWFDRAEEEFESGVGYLDVETVVPRDCLLYLLAWRALDSFCPTLSDLLAPPPLLKKVEAVDNIQKQDYYYEAWANRIIVIDSEVQE